MLKNPYEIEFIVLAVALAGLWFELEQVRALELGSEVALVPLPVL